MSYMFLSYLGGFIYWMLIKFCKTSYNEEIEEKNIVRNIIVLIIFIFIVAFFSIKIF